MDFATAVKSGFRNYATFSGRAPRSEYWFWVLFSLIVIMVGAVIDAAIFRNSDNGLFAPLTSLALLVPGLAVAARRLHDRDYSGWWLLLYLTGIGEFVLLVWMCLKGTPGANRFGPNPLEVELAKKTAIRA